MRKISVAFGRVFKNEIKMPQKIIQVALGVVVNANHEILIARRSIDAEQGELWEFPGGKIEIFETAYEALCRELKEEVGITVLQAQTLTNLSYEYTEKQVYLNCWYVSEFSGKPSGLEGQALRWVMLDELKKITFPAANQHIIAELESRTQDFPSEK